MLGYGALDEGRIEEGVRRLAAVLDALLDRVQGVRQTLLRIPRREDVLDLRPAPGGTPLDRLVPGLGSVNPYVRQAAVWIVTDDANYAELGRLTSASLAPGRRAK